MPCRPTCCVSLRSWQAIGAGWISVSRAPARSKHERRIFARHPKNTFAKSVRSRHGDRPVRSPHLVGASKNARRDDRKLITKFVRTRSAVRWWIAALGRFNFLSTPRSATPQIPASRAPRRARKPRQPLDRSCHAPCEPTLSEVSCGPPAPGQEMTHPAETYPR
jgi:hypothetical protein